MTATSVVRQKKCSPELIPERGVSTRAWKSPLQLKNGLPGESKLGKNETNDADTLIIHDTAFADIFISTAFYTLGFNLSLCLSCLKHTLSVCLFTIKYKVSKCSQKSARFCYRYVNSLLIQLQLVNNQHQRQSEVSSPCLP